MPGCTSCCFFPNLCLPSLLPIVKREQRREDNVEITELVSVRLKLFFVLIPTKFCVLLDGNLSSTLMLLRNLEKSRSRNLFYHLNSELG